MTELTELYHCLDTLQDVQSVIELSHLTISLSMWLVMHCSRMRPSALESSLGPCLKLVAWLQSRMKNEKVDNRHDRVNLSDQDAVRRIHCQQQ
jgi:hypothetical protein